MQFAKDSFFVALQERLAGLNPARVVTVSQGRRCLAMVVLENLPPTTKKRKPNTFYIELGAAQLVSGGAGIAG